MPTTMTVRSDWVDVQADLCPRWGHVQRYGKCPKISNTLFHTILAYILLFMQLSIKIICGMANSVDPDQTAPLGAV